MRRRKVRTRYHKTVTWQSNAQDNPLKWPQVSP